MTDETDRRGEMFDRLDAAITDGEQWLTAYGPWYLGKDLIRELVAVAREARAVLDADGFGR